MKCLLFNQILFSNAGIVKETCYIHDTKHDRFYYVDTLVRTSSIISSVVPDLKTKLGSFQPDMLGVTQPVSQPGFNQSLSHCEPGIICLPGESGRPLRQAYSLPQTELSNGFTVSQLARQSSA